MRPSTWPAPCPVCFAGPDNACSSRSGTRIPEIHAERQEGEHGAWTRIYDSLHRDHALKFQTQPLRRTA